MLIQLYVHVCAGPTVGFIVQEYTVTEGEGNGVLNVIVERLPEDMTPFSVLFDAHDGTAVGKG